MSDIPVDGTCAPKFTAVRDAFVANFTDRGEVGARVSVIRDGETVVDLWGGYTAEDRAEPWRDDHLVCCMSVSKGVTALAAHLLADRGQLRYDDPVCTYWPEFAQAGKAHITVRQALAHQASLAVIDDAEPGDVLDWDVFTTKIAAQPPNWTPGTAETYHSVTFGFLIGEIVRRIDGRTIDRFIADELAGPLDADFVLGCSDDDLARLVPAIRNPANTLTNGGLINEKTTAMFKGFPADPAFTTTPEYFKHVFPSGNGVSHALGIARLFQPFACGGVGNGKRLFSTETIAAASAEQWRHDDSMFGNEFRVALGLLLNIPFNYWGREGNVGTAGAGGYCAFADPKSRLSFGYTPNRYTTGDGLGDEQAALVDALYRCVR